MAWIPVHQTLLRHRKMIILATSLNMPRQHMAGCLIALWTWAIDNAPSGKLGDLPVEVVAFAAEWDGEAASFYSALQRAGFVDPDGKIHDWEEYAGKLINQRNANADRMKKVRAANVQRTSETHAKTNTKRAANVSRKSTVENSREEKSTEEGDITILSGADAPERGRNPHWDSLVSGIGIVPSTEGERSRYGKVIADLRRDGVTPKQIEAACRNYSSHFGDAAMTPEAIIKHFSLLQTVGIRKVRVGESSAVIAVNGTEVLVGRKTAGNINAIQRSRGNNVDESDF